MDLEMSEIRPTAVSLTWPEIMLACNVGIMRRISALRNGRSGRYGATEEDSWGHDINGAMAEMAVAKWASVFWSGTVGRVDTADVGVLQVRSKTKRTDRLVIRPDDVDNEIYVSVRVETPRCQLCGWLKGSEAKRLEWLVSVNRPPMYFVADEHLRPMESLRCARN